VNLHNFQICAQNYRIVDRYDRRNSHASVAVKWVTVSLSDHEVHHCHYDDDRLRFGQA
jgi:hypothetical protein